MVITDFNNSKILLIENDNSHLNFVKDTNSKSIEPPTLQTALEQYNTSIDVEENMICKKEIQEILGEESFIKKLSSVYANRAVYL